MERFRGRFETKMDPKGRLSLATSLKDALPESDHRIVITNSQYKNSRCLDLYTHAAWTRLEKRISRLSPLKSEVQEFQRFYLAGGQRLELDLQGRFIIPLSLRKYAELSSECVLVGLGDKLEIWSLHHWTRIYEGLAQNFETTLAQVAQLDVDQNSADSE
jgi:MraZ protein